MTAAIWTTKACNAAEILDLIQDGCKKFALCHLSQTNNSPELVMTTVYNVLLAAGIQPGRDVLIQTQSRSEVSRILNFERGSLCRILI